MTSRPYTLLTGATGLIGGHLVFELLRLQVPLAILVRNSKFRSAHQKVELLIGQLEANSQHQFIRPHILVGDLTDSHCLGLSGDDKDWLKRNCGRVLHNAAHLSFKPAENHLDREPYRTNVDGLVRLAEFCRASDIDEFHHVSSAYVCGNRQGLVLESELNCHQEFSNNYEHSKLLGEELLRSYFERLTVYRPSIVVDPSLKLLNIGDRTIYQAFSMYEYLAKMVGTPLEGELLSLIGLTGDERKNLVPADWVAGMIARIFLDQTHHGKTYHLTHPSGTTIRELDSAFCQALVDRGLPRRRSQILDHDLASHSEMIRQFINTFAPYFRDDPTFDQSNLRDVLNNDELLAPEINRAVLKDLVVKQKAPILPPYKSSRQQKDSDVSVDGRFDWVNAFEISQSREFEDSDDLKMGLLLHGPDGGDWMLIQNSTGELTLEMGGAETSEIVLCLSSQDWLALLESRVRLHTLLKSGLAVIERRCEIDDDFDRIDRLLGCVRSQYMARNSRLLGAGNVV